MTKEEVLSNCVVSGTLVYLPPDQLDRALYLEVAKALNLIGGKWRGGKTAAFVFPQDPTEMLAAIANGDRRDLKKEFQFFETPDALADTLVCLADIEADHKILEPSAGQGALVKAIIRRHGCLPVFCYELMDVNRIALCKVPGTVLWGKDFIAEDVPGAFDRIVANPPFSKNWDIYHIQKMYACLAGGGRLVSVASKHWQLSNNKKETLFREWLDDVGAEIYPVEAGAFGSSGTPVATVIIVIDKGAA